MFGNVLGAARGEIADQADQAAIFLKLILIKWDERILSCRNLLKTAFIFRGPYPSYRRVFMIFKLCAGNDPSRQRRR